MRLRHARVGLELHERKTGQGGALLLLHELYGSARDWDGEFDAWPGPVYALDFSGHGASQRLRGGAYMAELLLGDADVALAAIGSAALAGRGLGAYVALLLAGARNDVVPAALLMPGSGLNGGGAQPEVEVRPFELWTDASAGERNGADRRVSVFEGDPRPAPYAGRFARAARRLLLVEDGEPRPPWWEEARRAPNAVRVESGAAAIAMLGRAAK